LPTMTGGGTDNFCSQRGENTFEPTKKKPQQEDLAVGFQVKGTGGGASPAPAQQKREMFKGTCKEGLGVVGNDYYPNNSAVREVVFDQRRKESPDRDMFKN